MVVIDIDKEMRRQKKEERDGKNKMERNGETNEKYLGD